MDGATSPDGSTPCSPLVSPSPGTVVAKQVSGPIVIDGDLSDWGCPKFASLTPSNAAKVLPRTSGATVTVTGEFAIRWDATSLYFAVRVTDGNVGGNNATDPYLNDAVEIYLAGDTTLTGDYTNIDHQYVVDYKNLRTDYGPKPIATQHFTTNPRELTSAVSVGQGGLGPRDEGRGERPRSRVGRGGAVDPVQSGAGRQAAAQNPDWVVWAFSSRTARARAPRPSVARTSRRGPYRSATPSSSGASRSSESRRSISRGAQRSARSSRTGMCQ